MTNREVVLKAFDEMGEGAVPRVALVHAISQRQVVNEVLATQLVDQAVKDGLLTVDPLGIVRKA